VHAAAWGPLATLVSLVLGALALGGAMVGMVLGHWYLVTPDLSTRPLIGMTLALLAAVALQALLLPLQMGLVAGDAARLAGASRPMPSPSGCACSWASSCRSCWPP